MRSGKQKEVSVEPQSSIVAQLAPRVATMALQRARLRGKPLVVRRRVPPVSHLRELEDPHRKDVAVSKQLVHPQGIVQQPTATLFKRGRLADHRDLVAVDSDTKTGAHLVPN